MQLLRRVDLFDTALEKMPHVVGRANGYSVAGIETPLLGRRGRGPLAQPEPLEPVALAPAKVTANALLLPVERGAGRLARERAAVATPEL